jgi:hypothetical protein
VTKISGLVNALQKRRTSNARHGTLSAWSSFFLASFLSFPFRYLSMQVSTVSDFRRAVRFGPYAWPGGYDIFAITSDGGVLCAKCMNAERRLIIDSIATKRNDGWQVAAIGTTADTDDEVRCDHCNTVLQEEWKAEAETTTEEEG